MPGAKHNYKSAIGAQLKILYKIYKEEQNINGALSCGAAAIKLLNEDTQDYESFKKDFNSYLAGKVNRFNDDFDLVNKLGRYTGISSVK